MSASSVRPPSAVEKDLLRRLISQRLSADAFDETLDACLVRTIDDYGSLELHGFAIRLPSGQRRPELESLDEDGIAVYGLLHVDQEGKPIELELMKEDGSRIVRSLDRLNWKLPTEDWPPGWV